MTNYEVITAEEAESRFGIADKIWYPYFDFADDQEIRLYDGKTVIDGDFATDEDEDWSPYNVIIDGDLEVRGAIDWHDYGGGNFLWVTGNAVAESVIAQGCPSITILGDLDAQHGIVGFYGDDGGILTVHGDVRAPWLFNVMYFNFEFGGEVSGVLLGDEYRVNRPVDFDDGDDASEVLVVEVLEEDGCIDATKLANWVRGGNQPFRAGAKPAHLKAADLIDELLENPEAVTELDLSEHKLREFPEGILKFSRLEVLQLSRNEITEIPDEIAQLERLEWLDLSHNPLSELPAGISKLERLRQLDLEFTRLQEFPDGFGALSSLQSLNVSHTPVSFPGRFAGLEDLEELVVSRITADRSDVPAAIFELESLRTLDLGSNQWNSIPAALESLENLEELDLASALGGIESIADLSKLSKLTKLEFSGLRTGPEYPHHDLLATALACPHLEELHLDRWGEQTDYNPDSGEHEVVREALVALPDDAFEKMPGLRWLDLSFNNLESLPESLYALEDLEFVDLRYNPLSRETLARIREELTEVKLDLRHVKTRFDMDDPHFRAVNAKVKQASQTMQRSDWADAVPLFVEAIQMCEPGTAYSDYDELLAHYGVVYSLSHHIAQLDGEERSHRVDECITWARRALDLVPDMSQIWHFTDLGAFQKEVTRIAGNGLAWHLQENATTFEEWEEAIEVAQRAADCVEGEQHWFIYDTQVRALLGADRHEEAFRIVERVLSEDPTFEDFQDIQADPEYQRWLAEN